MADMTKKFSGPNIMLRIESLAFAFIFLFIYFFILRASWILFAGFILLPDIAFVGYIFSRKAGGICYDITHTYTLPLLMLALCFLGAVNGSLSDLFIEVALIWFAHISIDRMFGWGLSYGKGFKDSHMQRV